MKPKVAWIGLGTMGQPMAGHLLRAGFPLVVHNRSPERARPLAEAGAAVAASPAQAAAQAECTIVMVTDPQAFEAVLTGPGGVAEGLQPGSLLVDMGTDGPRAARRAAELAARRGAAFVDAPVLGSREPAERGQLVIMAGGEARDVERARAILEPLARSIHRVGPAGAGQTMKLAVNLMLGHMLTGLAGAVALVRAAGLGAAELVEILDAGLASPYFRLKGGQMVRGDFEPQFTLDLARKDLRLIRGALDELGVPLPTLGPILSLFDEAARRGFGQEDGAAVVKLWPEAYGGTTKA